jgi:hypothetical protein
LEGEGPEGDDGVGDDDDAVQAANVHQKEEAWDKHWDLEGKGKALAHKLSVTSKLTIHFFRGGEPGGDIPTRLLSLVITVGATIFYKKCMLTSAVIRATLEINFRVPVQYR